MERPFRHFFPGHLAEAHRHFSPFSPRGLFNGATMRGAGPPVVNLFEWTTTQAGRAQWPRRPVRGINQFRENARRWQSCIEARETAARRGFRSSRALSSTSLRPLRRFFENRREGKKIKRFTVRQVSKENIFEYFVGKKYFRLLLLGCWGLLFRGMNCFDVVSSQSNIKGYYTSSYFPSSLHDNLLSHLKIFTRAV